MGQVQQYGNNACGTLVKLNRLQLHTPFRSHSINVDKRRPVAASYRTLAATGSFFALFFYRSLFPRQIKCTGLLDITDFRRGDHCFHGWFFILNVFVLLAHHKHLLSTEFRKGQHSFGLNKFYHKKSDKSNCLAGMPHSSSTQSFFCHNAFIVLANTIPMMIDETTSSKPAKRTNICDDSSLAAKIAAMVAAHIGKV